MRTTRSRNEQPKPYPLPRRVKAIRDPEYLDPKGELEERRWEEVQDHPEDIFDLDEELEEEN